MASPHSSIVPAQQNNNNNNNNNNRNRNIISNNNNNNNRNINNNNNNVQWQSMRCHRCHLWVASFPRNLQIEIVGYSTLRPYGCPTNTWETCIVLNNMDNVHLGDMVEVHLGDFVNRVSNVHCIQCSAILGWKSIITGLHYVRVSNTLAWGPDLNTQIRSRI